MFLWFQLILVFNTLSNNTVKATPYISLELRSNERLSYSTTLSSLLYPSLLNLIFECSLPIIMYHPLKGPLRYDQSGFYRVIQFQSPIL